MAMRALSPSQITVIIPSHASTEAIIFPPLSPRLAHVRILVTKFVAGASCCDSGDRKTSFLIWESPIVEYRGIFLTLIGRWL
jgi:hypothetical protein